jgi:hypothetical protein
MGIRAKCSIADHRVVWVRQHIEYGCEVQINADTPEFFPHGLADATGESNRARLTKPRGWRKVGEGRSETVHPAPFMINSDQGRVVRKQGVNLCTEAKKGVRILVITAKQDHTAGL